MERDKNKRRDGLHLNIRILAFSILFSTGMVLLFTLVAPFFVDDTINLSQFYPIVLPVGFILISFIIYYIIDNL